MGIDPQRSLDLLRYKRGELHAEGLISDREFDSLIMRQGAVPRLESYDAIKATLQKIVDELDNRSCCPEDNLGWISELLDMAAQRGVKPGRK
jgi:hypothetical protein